MVDFSEKQQNGFDLRTSAAITDALDKSHAIIEFTPQGEIIKANQNFLSAMQYSLSEIVGQHHSMFVDPTERTTRKITSSSGQVWQGETSNNLNING